MKQFLLISSAALALCFSLISAAVDENETLGDMMFLLVDQVQGLASVERLHTAAADGDKKDGVLKRAKHRCTGAQYILMHVDKNKGVINAQGDFEEQVLTPPKFLITPKADLRALMNDFSQTVKNTMALFFDINLELDKLLATRPADRKVNVITKLVTDKLDPAIKAAHLKFTIQH